MCEILLTETPLNSALNHIFRIYSARPCRLRDLERSISPEPAITRRYSFFESLTYPKPDRWIALIPTHIFQLSMGNAIGNLKGYEEISLCELGYRIQEISPALDKRIINK